MTAPGPVTIKFTKKGGKGRAVMTICKAHGDGEPMPVKSITIDQEGDENIEVEVEDAKDHRLMVNLDGKRLLKKVDYELVVQN